MRCNAALFALGLHAIGTPSRAGKYVLLALDRSFLANDLRKQLQLRTAKPLAGARRRADRTVVLQQQPVAPVFLQLGHIAFGAANLREPGEARLEALDRLERREIVRARFDCTLIDQFVEPLFAE